MIENILEERQFALNFLEPFSNCGIRLIIKSQEVPPVPSKQSTKSSSPSALANGGVHFSTVP